MYPTRQSSPEGGRALRVAVRVLALAAVATSLANSTVPAQAQTFTDVTESAGLDYLQHLPQSPPNCIFDGIVCPIEDPPICFDLGDTCEVDRMSGGVAVGDYDGDSWPDLYVTRLDAPDLLFHNEGDGTFVDRSDATGLSAYNLQSNGALFSDLDRDGDLDIYVSVVGEEDDPANLRNHLFVQQDDGTFTEEAIARGAAIDFGTRQRNKSVAVGDFDLDGWPDLHVNEWNADSTSHGRLLRNLGPDAPGHFEDVTEAAGVVLDDVFAFSSSFTDLDRDGFPDLAVAADFGTSRLFWNNGDGTFTDGTVAAGVGTDENGMGSTIADWDGDGDLDWFVTSIYDADETCDLVLCNWGYSGNRLYRNEGHRLFSDATDSAGVRDGGWGWGTVFFDYDNDSDLDLVMTNGVDFPDTDIELQYTDDPMRLWRNDGPGGMTEVAESLGITSRGSGKGLVVFDYDNDGDLDLFVVNNGSGPNLYRNDSPPGARWLRVRTIGTRSNPEGLGAVVTVRGIAASERQIRVVGSASHFLGQSESIAHFGFGATPEAVIPEVGIQWPSGVRQAIKGVSFDQTLTVREPMVIEP